MVPPGRKELLPSPCSARDSRECIGDTGCFMQQGVDSLGAGSLPGPILAVVGWRWVAPGHREAVVLGVEMFSCWICCPICWDRAFPEAPPASSSSSSSSS
ncbi:hypothetical protein L1987_33095 [Smallanthus sonchifolius]|uniref:Uncharacterized protein n=1 Tax=Smallanthus sonchifolius TaxID=185202 RepID=A0ACB9HRG4_9ASTR|nr:hypothetical protein L1987_33095 [Smallanthus sonchifolius]